MIARPARPDHEPTLWEETEDASVADVVIGVDAPDLLPTYSYRIPAHLEPLLTVGTCVHVSFGGRETLGYVFALRSIPATDPLAGRLKDIIAVVEDAVTFNKEQAASAKWISDTYICDLASAIKCIAPAAFGARVVITAALSSFEGASDGLPINQSHIIEILKRLDGRAELDELRKQAALSAFSGSYTALVRKGLIYESRIVSRSKVVSKQVKAYALGFPTAVQDGKKSPAQDRILKVLEEFEQAGKTPVLPEKLLSVAQSSTSALKALVDKGTVVVRSLDVRRAPGPAPSARSVAPKLTAGQNRASQWIAKQVTENSPYSSTALLFGVTASGKTEVYLDAIDRTLKTGRSAIVLVPEIALTAQVVEVFSSRFGDEVAVLHSKLSEGERHDEWRRLQQSKARIAVGARSAVFAPVDNIGLIVVDEEHESSYKQENQPRYNARDVALECARLNGSTVILGSATPALETYFSAITGKSALLEMPERIDNRPLPSVELIDLRDEMKEHRSLFSRRLIDGIEHTLANGKQAILFLNRRGYAQFILCRDCGYVARCPNCAVSLAFHSAWNVLRCHHCGYSRKAPTVCPSCSGTKIKTFGVGTEKVEEEVMKCFPNARVARMDRDTTSRKGAHAGILKRFRERDADILIGTQMVAKGLDFPNVTLVGVISADTSINMPDFRAAERTFQLLTQVAGRAGRGEHPGEVIIQTFNPEHYSLQMAVKQDYKGFYDQEIKFREELKYPPFSRFANLIISDTDSGTVRQQAQAIADSFRMYLPEEIELIGPAPAPLSKLRNSYRWHIALRAPVDVPLSEIVRNGLSNLTTAHRRHVSVDIDPQSMV
jgi:primosomal protein N' (replication factor Y)